MLHGAAILLRHDLPYASARSCAIRYCEILPGDVAGEVDRDVVDCGDWIGGVGRQLELAIGCYVKGDLEEVCFVSRCE